MKRLFTGMLILLGLLVLPTWAAATGSAALLDIDGAIGPATAQYYQEASAEAVARNASLIILRMDTPGGLDTAMRDIIKHILDSPIPVVAYVAPGGARAASAGTYILYASHVAVMAPATNLGAASPISVFPSHEPPASPLPTEQKPRAPPETSAPAQPQDTLERKVMNDAVAYIRSLAELRHRNADWGEKAVREAVSLSADQALKQGVIEFEAKDIPDLLKQLDGRTVTLGGNRSVALHTQGMVVEALPMNWRLALLSILTSPSVAYFLMLAGIYGLLIEAYSPGAIFPGVIGGISLLLALYAFQILPISYAGLVLIALGVGMIVGETLTGSGVLGVGGVVAFVLGSIMLFDRGVPGFELPIGIVAGVATAAALVLLFITTQVMRARRGKVVSGQHAMLHEEATALEDFSGEGWVSVRGERWRARATVPVQKGQMLHIREIKGLLLLVDADKQEKGRD